jgi:hypothetical protein
LDVGRGVLMDFSLIFDKLVIFVFIVRREALFFRWLFLEYRDLRDNLRRHVDFGGFAPPTALAGR